MIPRRELLDRPETLFVLNMETVVGESDWLEIRRIGVIEQAVPRFDR